MVMVVSNSNGGGFLLHVFLPLTTVHCHYMESVMLSSCVGLVETCPHRHWRESLEAILVCCSFYWRSDESAQGEIE